MTHYTYVLRCSDDTLYTGYTTDLTRRISEHNSGDGAKYTSGRTPVQLVYVEFHNDRSSAMSREYEIKQMPKNAKERLVGDKNKIEISLKN